MPTLPPARAQLTPFPRTPRVTWRGVNMARHAPQLRAAVANPVANAASGDLPTIVFCGDSTMADVGNDSFNVLETTFGLLKHKFQTDNPGTTFRFLNRAVVGSTWNHLANAAVANWPSWYSQQAALWINGYISPTGNGGANKAPDLVIIQSGTNDNASWNFADVKAVLDKFANATLFPKTPDIWLCTSIGRTRDPARSTAIQAAGSLLATNGNRMVTRSGGASINSTYVKPLGLLDFGRMDQMCRWGMDPATQRLEQVDVSAYQGVTALGTAGFTLPACDGDLDYTATFPGQSATLWAGRAMRISTGPAMNAGSITPLLLIQRSGTSVITQYQPGSGTVAGTNATVADGVDVVIRLVCKQSHMILTVNGQTVFDQPVARPVASFAPRIWWGADGANNIVLNLTSYRAGRAVPYAATSSDLLAWGSNPTGVNGSTAGNMVNHPSSLHIQEVVVPVLANEDFYLG